MRKNLGTYFLRRGYLSTCKAIMLPKHLRYHAAFSNTGQSTHFRLAAAFNCSSCNPSLGSFEDVLPTQIKYCRNYNPIVSCWFFLFFLFISLSFCFPHSWIPAWLLDVKPKLWRQQFQYRVESGKLNNSTLYK